MKSCEHDSSDLKVAWFNATSVPRYVCAPNSAHNLKNRCTGLANGKITPETREVVTEYRDRRF
jgi:hypothetical protein